MAFLPTKHQIPQLLIYAHPHYSPDITGFILTDYEDFEKGCSTELRPRLEEVESGHFQVLQSTGI